MFLGSFISPQSKSHLSMSGVSMDCSSWIYNTSSPRTDTEKKQEKPIKPKASGTFTDSQVLNDYLRDFEQKEKEADMSSSFNMSGIIVE